MEGWCLLEWSSLEEPLVHQMIDWLCRTTGHFGRQVGSESLLYESELLGTDGLARTNKPLGSASSLLSVSYVGAEASDKSKLAMVLPRDDLVLSPSGWQFWQINAMFFDWRKSVLLIPNKETEQIMIH